MEKSNQQLRSKAQRYAIKFLIQKYRSEYQELYRAYLFNRGITITTSELQDERELMNQKVKKENQNSTIK